MREIVKDVGFLLAMLDAGNLKINSITLPLSADINYSSFDVGRSKEMLSVAQFIGYLYVK